jgi:hypothetical protein
MAHQTSTILRNQSTPRPTGRLMDVEFFWDHFSYFSLHMSRASEQLLVSQTDARITD